MSGDRVLRSRASKNRTVQDICPVADGCANCSKENSTLSKDFISFDSDEEEVTLTFQEVLEKVFQVTFDPIPTTIQLCHNCGLQLYNLYKCYEEFLELCAIDSTLSKVIKNKTNSSDNSAVRPLKLKIKIPKSKSKNVPKTYQQKEKKSKLKSKLKKDSEDVSQNNTRGIGGRDHNVEIDMSIPWDSFGPTDDSNDNMDDIDMEDMKPSPLTFLSDQDIQEGDTNSPAPGSGIDKIEKGIVSESTTPTITTQSDEFDLTERLEPVVGPYGKLNKQRTCPICNKTFPKPFRMRIHLTKIHFVECGVPADKLVRKYTPHDCGICGKTLASKSSLGTHIRYFHEKQKNHTCTVCNKAFPTQDALKVHWKVHTNPGQKTALCSICGRSFGTKGNLKVHYARHFSDSVSKYKFKCTICGKALRKAENLKDHMLEHENRRTFICDICGNSYNTEKSLRNHRAAHIDQIPCPYCERTFKRKSALKDHLISSAHALSLEEAKATAGIITKKIEITDGDD